jgi:hypothetical protein
MAFRDLLKKWFVSDKDSQIAREARGRSAIYLGQGEVGPTGEIPPSTTPFGLGRYLSVDQSLMYRYRDYELMDDYPEVNAALNIYADDSTVPDTLHKKTIWATSYDRVIRDLLDDCLHRRLRIEEDVWAGVRTLAMYGNNFAEIVVTEKGVVGLNFLPVATVRRIVDDKGVTLGFAQDMGGRFGFNIKDEKDFVQAREKYGKEKGGADGITLFWPWEIVHWRLRSKHMRSVYGYSVIDGARWTWKRLKMMEDMALLFKLTRSQARYVFYVDTGDLPPRQAMALVEKTRRRYKKKKYIDSSTGEVQFKNDILNPQEDFWIPTKGNKESTRIDNISGPEYQNTDDLEYFRSKLFAGLTVPKSYLGLEGEANKASLAQEDVRFARSCMRLQREWINGMRKVMRVHLAVLNIDPDTVKWDLNMSVPSNIMELAQMEVLNARADLAGSLSDWMPRPWLMQYVLKFTEDDALFLTAQKQDEQDADAKREAATLADIQKMYPGVDTSEIEAGGEEGEPEGAPPRVTATGAAESKAMQAALADLLESSRNAEKISEQVLKRLDRIGIMSEMVRRVRA